MKKVSLCRLTAVFVCVMASAGVLSGQWRQFRFDPLRLGVNASETILSPSTVAGLKQKWTFPTPRGRVVASAVVEQGVVYFVSGDGFVYAVNATTGARIWRSLRIGAGGSAPAFSQGRIFVGTGVDSGFVYALNAATGQILWRSIQGTPHASSPAVVGDVVYIGSGEEVWALNAATGAFVWRKNVGNVIYPAPSVANGMVYVAANFGAFHALDAKTGNIIWSRNIGGSLIFSASAVSNGIVYVGATDEFTYALNGATGAILWRRHTPYHATAPAVVNGVVYIGTNDHILYALNAATGIPIWTTDIGQFIQYDGPTYANGVLYVPAGWSMFVVDAATGTILKELPTEFPVTAAPVVVNGMVYVGSHDRRLYAFGL
jgi:outer membrane protein assembly factor BamB